MTVGGDFKIGPNAGIGITISSSGNIDSVGIATIKGNVTIGGTEIISDSGTYLHIKTNAGEDMAKFQKDGGTFLYSKVLIYLHRFHHRLQYLHHLL